LPLYARVRPDVPLGEYSTALALDAQKIIVTAPKSNPKIK
jgi:hypothetical protein